MNEPPDYDVDSEARDLLAMLAGYEAKDTGGLRWSADGKYWYWPNSANKRDSQQAVASALRRAYSSGQSQKK